MKNLAIATMMMAAIPGLAVADLAVQLGAPWDGVTVPAGQQCRLFGGNGKTPPMTVTGVPQGTAWIVMEFNDKSYSPLSRNGGHGILGYPARAGATSVKALPGMTANLPYGAVVIKKARSTGRYASPGYLPPCSGGKGNRYTVDVKAVAATGKVLDSVKNLSIGKY